MIIVGPPESPPLDPALVDALARVKATKRCPQYLLAATTDQELIVALKRYTATADCPKYLTTAAAPLLAQTPARLEHLAAADA